MRPGSLWWQLRSAWQPRLVIPKSPADEMVLSTPIKVQGLLKELVRLRRPVALQAADGRFVASGPLQIDSVRGISIQLGSEVSTEQGAQWPWPLNATASSPNGLMLFTLAKGELGPGGLIRAPWPTQLIQMQSRRHFRLAALGGVKRRVWLRLESGHPRLAVRDVSEEGLCVEVSGDFWASPGTVFAAELELGDDRLPIPAVEVVHARSRNTGEPAWLGARFLHMGEEQLRALRRWLVAAQASSLLPLGDRA
jgi:hypothetical protein